MVACSTKEVDKMAQPQPCGPISLTGKQSGIPCSATKIFIDQRKDYMGKSVNTSISLFHAGNIRMEILCRDSVNSLQ